MSLIDPEIFRRLPLGSPEHMRTMTHPDLATMRTAAVKALAKQIDSALEPLGYRRKRNDWKKGSPFGWSLLQIQRSQYGFNLFINVGKWPLVHLEPPRMVRLQQFCPELPQVDYEVSGFDYVALQENAALRDAVVEVIRTRVAPWLESRHAIGSLFFSEKPADMAKIPLFQASSTAAPAQL